jgi:CPA1 family monovalent cation:H+ antiporter
LRGAVSLALALTVAEDLSLSGDIRRFIATTVTGYVLLTLFVNGVTLRPLMRLLKLNKLSPVALGVRDRAVVMTLSEVREGLAAIGAGDRIDRDVGEAVLGEFDARLAAERAHRAETRSLSRDQLLKVGLTVLTAHESERCYALLKAAVIDRSMAEQLLAQAQRLRETVRAKGHLGFEAAWPKNLGYSLRFRLSLMLHNRFGIELPLADALANRFELLMNQRLVLAESIPFCRTKLASLLGEEGTQALIELTAKRAAAVSAALNALKLQYPAYADALQRQYLGKLARDMEREGYRALYNQAVISGEVWQSLTGDAERRWRESSGGDQASLDRRPKLDTELSAQQLIARVPIFRDLSDEAQHRIARLLRPELTLPGMTILRKGDKGDSMYFIASGAARVAIGDGGVELGSGDFFGELALLTGQPRSADVISLGFCRLLQLSARDFRSLLDGDPALKSRIETVAKERMNAP